MNRGSAGDAVWAFVAFLLILHRQRRGKLTPRNMWIDIRAAAEMHRAALAYAECIN